MAEHFKNARPSTRSKHEKGLATLKKGQEKTEKGDQRRKPQGRKRRRDAEGKK
jgi:hypothetical protein